MMGLIFRRRPGDLLFFLSSSGNTQGISSKAAFLPTKDVSEQEIAFSDSWKNDDYRGIYFFLGDTVSDQGKFVNDVKSYIGTDTVRFLWIKNPNDPVNEWSADQLQVNQDPQSGTGVISQVSPISFRNYSLVIGSGCTIGLNAPLDGFTITKALNMNNIRFETDAGVYSIYTEGEEVALSFKSNEEGAFQFFLLLRDSSENDPVSDIDKLDAGCRFFVDDVQYPDYHYLQSLRYPILTLQNGPITIYGNLDPVSPLDHSHSYFNFLKPSSQRSEIMSYYRTVIGEPIILTPAPSDTSPQGPQLVFSVRPIVHPTVQESSQLPYTADPFYLTLKGAFKITVGKPSLTADGGPVHRIMCGTSGVEYVGLMSENDYLIHFFPDQPAYAPHFIHVTGSQSSDNAPPSDAQVLTDLATTSWAYVTPAKAEPEPVYYAQPEDSLLYEAGMTDQFYKYLEVAACTLPSQMGSDSVQGFPMVPYSGVDPNFVEDFRQLELKVLNPYRRKRMYAIKRDTESSQFDEQDRTGVTPQGLIAYFHDSVWEKLTLATFGDSQKQLQLQKIEDPLKSALLSNQLFLVASVPEKFGGYCVEPFELTIRDWNFNLSPSTWNDYQTIMIIKYSDSSIEELVQNPKAWLWPEAATSDTQDRLIKIIAEAKENVKTNPDFETFVEAVTSKTWNGILFLNCKVPVTGLPPQLEGIAAGIDPQKFCAHHVGIGIAPTYRDSTGIHQRNASLFGLIHYNDPGNLFYENKDYDFKVLSLRILFKNSAIANFSCLIELMINKLFGENSTLKDSQIGNNLIFNGVYQKSQDKTGVDSYLFIQEGPNVFEMKTSRVLECVETTKAQFITLHNPTEGDNTVQSKFILWGNLQFKILPLDVFSFGNEYSEEGKITEKGQLWFSNLAVNMHFDRGSQNKTFTFDAGTVAFDMAGSEPRPDSLFSRFPLKVAGMFQASQGVTPGGEGIIPVDSPLGQSDLNYPWYALNFGLELGSLGDLAGDAGFVVTLAVCWAPSNDNEYQTYLGIKLPNLKNSNSEIPLEGVINLSIGSIELIVEDKIKYMLKFKTIALKLLGFSFPPGQLDMLLFGNPSVTDRETLGWYAAYLKGGKK